MDGCAVQLLGTIPGFVPDGARVTEAFTEFKPDVIALGIPASDVDSLEALMADPTLADGLEPDQLDLHFMELIAEYGATAFVPSPDLLAAHETGARLAGIDLSDDEHTQMFTDTVKVRHLVQRTSSRKRLSAMKAAEVTDPYDLACHWDTELCKVKPLGKLEKSREVHMASEIRKMAKTSQRILVIVHVARHDGIFTLLTNGP